MANTLILLSGGQKLHKIEAAFNFYDKDKNGSLSLVELTDYFEGVLKLQNRKVSGKTVSEEEIKKLAAATAKKAFQDIDLNGDGSVSLSEFKVWIQSSGDLPENYANQKKAENESRRSDGVASFTTKDTQRRETGMVK